MAEVSMFPSPDGFMYKVIVKISMAELQQMANMNDVAELVTRELSTHLTGVLREKFVNGTIDRIIAETIKEVVKEIITAEVEQRVEEFFGDE